MFAHISTLCMKANPLSGKPTKWSDERLNSLSEAYLGSCQTSMFDQSLIRLCRLGVFMFLIHHFLATLRTSFASNYVANKDIVTNIRYSYKYKDILLDLVWYLGQYILEWIK